MQLRSFPPPQSAVGVPTTSGRWLADPVLARSGTIVTLMGTPLWRVVTPLSCQPESACFSSAFLDSLKNGMSYT